MTLAGLGIVSSKAPPQDFSEVAEVKRSHLRLRRLEFIKPAARASPAYECRPHLRHEVAVLAQIITFSATIHLGLFHN